MARDRSIRLIIRAQVDGAKRALSETADAARKVGEESEKASKRSTTASERMVHSARDNSQAWSTAGTALTAFGAASALAMGGSAKAAIDWETAWAGVSKTVDGSAQQMSALEGELRNMASTLPASHAEIAAVAEAAGQLGVRTEDVTSFTRTMIDLGESTNLSAEEAATSIAQMANVMGTSGDDVSRLGSALVELGNNGASTERDIMMMATRLSGAGALIGATESDVLALANTMSSLGIEAQLGGGVMSRVLQTINSEVISSGDNLAGFAQVAGMSAQEFAAAWQSDPVAALDSFIQGLSGIQSTGGDTVGVLSDLGIKGTENTSVLLRLTGAGDMLTESLDMSAQAWSENSALSEEAGKRYETVASKIQIARNNIVDAGISLGQVFMPAIESGSEMVAGLAGALADLPGPVQGVVGGLGATAGAVGLLGGGLLLTVPKVVETVDAFRDLREISPRVATGVGLAGKAAGGAVAAFAALQIAAAFSKDERAAVGIEATTAALLDMRDAASSVAIEELFAGLGSKDLVTGRHEIEGMADALARVFEPGVQGRIQDFGDNLFGISNEADTVRDQFDQIGQSLARMVSEGNTGQAEALFNEMVTQAEAAGYSVEQLMSLMPAYSEALAGVSNESRQAADDTAALAGAAGALPAELSPAEQALADQEAAAQEAADAYDELRSSVESLGSTLLGARGSARGYQEALDSAKASVKEYGDNLDITTEAGRANQSALDALAGSTIDYATSLMDAGRTSGEVAAVVAQGREDFIAQAEAMGMSSENASHLADQLGLIPENVQLMFEESGLDGIITDIDGTVDYAASVEALVQLGVEPQLATQMVETWIGEQAGKTATSQFSTDPAVAEERANAWISAQAEKTATALMDANADPAQAQADAWVAYAQSQRPQPYIDADSSPATSVAEAWRAMAAGMRPEATVDAQARPATSVAEGWRRYASGLTAVANVSARDSNARSIARGIVNSISGMWAFINVGARNYAGSLNMGGSDRTRRSAVAMGGMWDGPVKTYAGGGMDDWGRPVKREPMMGGPAFGRTNILWGEPETGWEAYISGHPAHKERNIGILDEAARRLGYRVEKLAMGGVRYGTVAASPVVTSSVDMAPLAAQVQALTAMVATLADRPVTVPVSVDAREIARGHMSGAARLGARAGWAGQPRIGGPR